MPALVLEARAGNDPLGTPLGVLTEASDIDVLIEDNGVGNGSFTIDLTHEQASWCERGAYIAVYRDVATGDLDDALTAFWIDTDTDVLLDEAEEGATEGNVGGRGTLAYLAEAVVWHRALLRPRRCAQPRRRRWFWRRVHPAKVLRRQLREARARGALPGITWDFTLAEDSSGDPWSEPDTRRFNIPIGLNLLELLDKLRDMDLEVLATPGLVVRAWDDYENDLSATVEFVAGESIADRLERERRQLRARSHILMEGENRQGRPRFRAVPATDAIREDLGRRSEGFFRVERTATRRLLRRTGRRKLRAWHKEWEGGINIEVEEEAEGHVAMVDYRPGDTIGLHVPAAEVGLEVPGYSHQAVRLASVRLHQAGDEPDYGVTLEVGNFLVG